MRQVSPTKTKLGWLNEDWLAVLIGFFFILLAVIGVLGPAGIPVVF